MSARREIEVWPEECFGEAVASEILLDTRRILEGEEKLAALRQLGDRFWPDHETEREAEIAPRLDRMVVFVMEIEHLSGKQAKELVPKAR